MKKLALLCLAMSCTAQPSPDVRLPVARFPLTNYDCTTLPLTAHIKFVRLSDNKAVVDKQVSQTDTSFNLSFNGLTPGAYRIDVSYESANGTVVATTSKEVTLVGGRGNNLSIVFDDAHPAQPLDSDADGFLDCEEVVAGSDPEDKASVPDPATETEAPAFDVTAAADGVGADRIRLTWEAATDRHTPRDQLQYFVLWSTEPGVAANVDTANCTPQTRCAKSALGATTLDITDLEALRTYYAKIVVRDARGNTAVANESGTDLELSTKTTLDNRPAIFLPIKSYTTSCIQPHYDPATGQPQFADSETQTCTTEREGGGATTTTCCTAAGTCGAATPSGSTTNPDNFRQLDVREGDELVVVISAEDGEVSFCNPAAQGGINGPDTPLCARITDKDVTDTRAQAAFVRVGVDLGPPGMSFDCGPITPQMTQPTCTLRYTPDYQAGGDAPGESKAYLVQLSADDNDDGLDVNTFLFQITVRNKGVPPRYTPLSAAANTQVLSTCSASAVPETIHFDVVRGVTTRVDLTSAIDLDGDRIQFKFGPLPPNVWLSTQAAPTADAPAHTLMTVRADEKDAGVINLSAQLVQTDEPSIATPLTILLHVFEAVTAPIDNASAADCSGGAPQAVADTGIATTQVLGAPIGAYYSNTQRQDLLVSAFNPVASAATLLRASLGGSPVALQQADFAGTPLYTATGLQTQPFVLAAGQLNGDAGSFDDVIFVETTATGLKLRFIDGASAAPVAAGTTAFSDLKLSGASTEWASRILALGVGDVEGDGDNDILLVGQQNTGPLQLGVMLVQSAPSTGKPTLVDPNHVRTVANWTYSLSEFAGLAMSHHPGAPAEVFLGHYALRGNVGSPYPYVATALLSVQRYRIDTGSFTAIELSSQSFPRSIQVASAADTNGSFTGGHGSGFGLSDLNRDGLDDLYVPAFAGYDVAVPPGAPKSMLMLAKQQPQPPAWTTLPTARPLLTGSGTFDALASTDFVHPSGGAPFGVVLHFRGGATPNERVWVQQAVPFAGTLRHQYESRVMMRFRGPTAAGAWLVPAPTNNSRTDYVDPEASRNPYTDCVNGLVLPGCWTMALQATNPFINDLTTADVDGDGRSELYETINWWADDANVEADRRNTLQRWTSIACQRLGSPTNDHLTKPALSSANTDDFKTGAVDHLTSTKLHFVSAGRWRRANAASPPQLAVLHMPDPAIAGYSSPNAVAGLRPYFNQISGATDNGAHELVQRVNGGIDGDVVLSTPALIANANAAGFNRIVYQDIDADGAADLIVAQDAQLPNVTSVFGQITVSFGRDDNSFTFDAPKQVLTTDHPIAALAVIDVDKDAVADLLYLEHDAFAVGWFKGSRDGSGKLSFGTLHREVFSVDLGMDHVADPTMKPLLFTQPPSAHGEVPLRVGDFDHDGFPDLAMIAFDRNLTGDATPVLAMLYGHPRLSDTDTAFDTETKYASKLTALTGDFIGAATARPSTQFQLLSSDFNGDGVTDFVVMASSTMDASSEIVRASDDALHPTAYVWTAVGQGNASAPARSYTLGETLLPDVSRIGAATVFDRNGDNVPDVAFTARDFTTAGSHLRRLFVFSFLGR